MLKCLVVDDEKLIRDLMADNIRRVPFLHLIRECRNTMETASVLQETEIDLIFLDIQMPGLSGLQFLESLSHPPMVIIVTAYRDYAVESFTLNVIDYLLKPVSFERFVKACNKANEFHQLIHRKPGDKELPGYFFTYVEYHLVKVVVSEILYIEGMKDYVKIHLATTTRPILTKLSMKIVVEKLKGYHFIRIHKSYITPIARITEVKGKSVCIGDKELPVGNLYKSALEGYL